MRELFCDSVFFGVLLSVSTYELGVFLKKKYKTAVFNPLLISVLLVIGVLLVFRIDYNVYYEGAKYLSYLLTPATVCLAVPLYEQVELLKRHGKAIVGGIFAGVLTSLVTIFVCASVFGFTHQEYVTLLPKSITTAIGMGVSEELGGMATITVAVIILTGILGNIIAEAVFRLFRIEEAVAKGVALGTSSHAIGTAKAMEIGEVEGAMSSLSIAVAGLMTVAVASVFANLI
ncbi:MAG: LrgB family protein [Lachnospiraceae bacterium]|nr:LrgB family protein [Lachnospiraceae bacterium]